jgi:hypothetical protein
MTNLKVGQKLWFVPFIAVLENCKWVCVERIRGNFAFVECGACLDLSKLINGKAALDGGRYSISGTVYLSRDFHDQDVEIRLLKRKIIAALEWMPFTVEQLKTIEKTLEVKND